MAKISQVSAKYIVHATIEIDGVVDRPDVIGAIFGQTEGLLGQDLELRELQRSGRIGRIEVNTETRTGKTAGNIILPSSLDKAETAIIAASLEIIQRIGPCNAKIKVTKIEDVRVSKRQFVITRAKELLKNLTESVLPDSQELADEVSHSVRMMEVSEYGKDRLPAGPAIEDSEEIILVEGRADVLTLLKHGFKNVISMNGTSVPQTIIELSRRKTITAFVDGDRGGDLNIQELLQVAEIDFVTKAPDGKEVEELTQKEIHKCLRSKIAAEQAKLEFSHKRPMPKPSMSAPEQQRGRPPQRPPQMQQRPPMSRSPLPPRAAAPPRVNRGASLNPDEKKKFKSLLEDLIGTRGACVLDQKLNILGKVPISELVSTLKSLSSGVYAVVMDGAVQKEVIEMAERANVRHVICTEANVPPGRINILTPDKLE
ncbi:TPA: DNA primase [Candidatus Woesearchaeota archaeon]|nr:DNA primase [Candidatus Woesearchaeota archaeon]